MKRQEIQPCNLTWQHIVWMLLIWWFISKDNAKIHNIGKWGYHLKSGMYLYFFLELIMISWQYSVPDTLNSLLLAVIKIKQVRFISIVLNVLSQFTVLSLRKKKKKQTCSVFFEKLLLITVVKVWHRKWALNRLVFVLSLNTKLKLRSLRLNMFALNTQLQTLPPFFGIWVCALWGCCNIWLPVCLHSKKKIHWCVL